MTDRSDEFGGNQMATCFVVQGFGKKTDFTDGRVLDLDASYAIIKEAVEAAGLMCIRADEIPHSGTIDAPMYRQLYHAELVIADLSTYNVNAAFELGIRYGLRPRATIIVAEDQFKNPFDVGHLVIRRYKHLGEDIGAKEAKRFCDDLKQAIADILANGETDSPVYTFLSDLAPPQEQKATTEFPETTLAQAIPAGGAARPTPVAPTSALAMAPAAPAAAAPETVGQDEQPVVTSAKSALDDALASIRSGDFANACPLLEEVHRQRPNDSFVVQQLALATYKSQQPTIEAALLKARDMLRELSPGSTNDPETLGLWGAIHKRLWEINHQAEDLDQAIAVCERGFHLKQDHYNGINLAHLLDMRALKALKAGDRDGCFADVVLAKRVRRQVIQYAMPLLDTDLDTEKRFWIVATLREAAVGLGDAAAAAQWQAAAQALPVATWMRESSETQIQAGQSTQAEIMRLCAASGAGRGV
jgi:hypothetical protein